MGHYRDIYWIGMGYLWQETVIYYVEQGVAGYRRQSAPPA